MAKGAGVGRVKKLHGPQVDFANPQSGGHQTVYIKAVILGGGQGLVDARVQFAVFLAQDGRMVGIGRHAAQANDDQVLEAAGVGIAAVGPKAPQAALGRQGLDAIGGLVIGPRRPRR